MFIVCYGAYAVDYIHANPAALRLAVMIAGAYFFFGLLHQLFHHEN